jgi:hypothetical protein
MLTAADIKPGVRLACNGYPGTVMRLCGDGMAEVRVPGGLTCVSIAELVRFQNHYTDRRYSPVAVNRAIEASNRSGRKISRREAQLIHALLRGRA